MAPSHAEVQPTTLVSSDADTVCAGPVPNFPAGPNTLDEVERIDMPSADVFFRDYVVQNKPVIITNAINDWPAMKTWGLSHFQKHADCEVSVAPLETKGPHAFYDKWIEDRKLWTFKRKPKSTDAADAPPANGGDAGEGGKDSGNTAEGADDRAAKEEATTGSDATDTTEEGPRHRRLPGVLMHDSLLVVCGIRCKLPMKDFLDNLDGRNNVTFYADGSGNMTKSFPFLQGDIVEPPLLKGLLNLKRQDLWLGRRSISKMHYDNLDNLFGQVLGTKRFVLVPPAESKKMVRGRLQMAYRLHEADDLGKFTRVPGGVVNNTTINFIPFDLEQPDLEDFPDVATLNKVTVDVRPGELLYLPFGWWHQVYAIPDEDHGLCASVTHFYENFYCRLGNQRSSKLTPIFPNPRYRSLLDRLGIDMSLDSSSSSDDDEKEEKNQEES